MKQRKKTEYGENRHSILKRRKIWKKYYRKNFEAKQNFYLHLFR